jgi:hypothetical protein
MQHQEGCDVERCMVCGHQALGCHYEGDDDRVWCATFGKLVPEQRGTWTGRWPGEVECEEFGWFARWTVCSGYGFEDIPDTGPTVVCGADHLHAHHDLNRLALAVAKGELRWDPAAERFVKA